MDEIYETISLLLSMLDYPLFDEFKKEESTFLECKRRGAKAFGKLIDEGFLVLAGSQAPCSTTPSIGSKLLDLRNQLLKDKILNTKGDNLIFESDYLFTSPSQAAAIVIGGSANGWIEWKDENGKTLDEILRKKFEIHSAT